MSALERSLCYRGFAEAFRSPRGGTQILSEEVIPAPSVDANTEFLEAFEPSVSKSACSLYASAHSGREQMALYEELIRWYDHFGLQRKARAELPDHVSVLLEFLHFLAHREHVCFEAGEDVSSLLKAQREFLEKYLLPLSASIAGATLNAPERYRVLASELNSFVQQRFVKLNVR
ncbi:MAG: molecular chaperone TorD family protein [Pseudomonadota bacterium]